MNPAGRPRSAMRLQHHALQSLLAVRPLERLYAGQGRRDGGGAVLVRQLLLGLPETEWNETTVAFERHFTQLGTLTLPGCLPLRERVDGGQGSFYLVSDAPRGATVGEFVRQAGPLPLGTAARIVVDLVDLLLHARAAGVHHYALHRGNVLIAAGGAVTLLDLGLAPFFLERLSGRLQRVHPAWDSLFPEPAVLAPELIAGEPLGEWTDLYGVGALLYLLTTGTLPYSGAAMVAYNAILAGRSSTDPRDVTPELDPLVASLVIACLKRTPSDRPPSLEALRAVLAPFALSAEAAFEPYRLGLTDRPWLERFEPLLRLVNTDGNPDAALPDEPDVVVPLFQVAGRPMSDVELLSRMSADQRRIYLAGGSAMSRATRQIETRRGMLLGVAIAVVAALIFGPRLLDGLGLFGAVPVISSRGWLDTAPAAARAAEGPDPRHERRPLVLYVER